MPDDESYKEGARRAFEKWWVEKGILHIPAGLHAASFGPVKEQAWAGFLRGVIWANSVDGQNKRLELLEKWEEATTNA